MKPAISAFFIVALIHGQPTPRTLSGSVGDANGALLSRVNVTLTPTAGGAPLRATTDGEGHYRLTGLAPGTYTARFEVGGFEAQEQRLTVPADRNPLLNVVLTPQSASGDTITVLTTADAASSRPAYLPQSGVAPGGILTAYGRFPNDVEARLTGGSNSISLPLLYKTPGQIGAVLPYMDLHPDLHPKFLELVGLGRPPVRAPIGIVSARPTFFTVDQSGSGAGILTTTAFDLVTPGSAAQPGGYYTAWLTNGGRSDAAPTVIQDRRNTFNRFDLYVANRPVPAGNILYYGPSGIDGLDQLNFQIPDRFPFLGCGAPLQIAVTSVAGGPVYFGNEVTIPVATAGGCEDALGFGRTEQSRLAAGGPVGTVEARISEVTFISSSASPRNAVFGTLTGSEWRKDTYRPPPAPGTCHFRWIPPGSPSGPRRLDFTGVGAFNVPWGSFNFSPTSNNGPYSLVFSFPANFATGSYTLTFASGFTVDGQPFAFQDSGAYDRAAGRMRESVALRFATFPPEIDYSAFFDRVAQSVESAPNDLRSRVLVDFNLLFSDPTRGNTAIRCVDNATSDFSFLKTAIENYIPLIPRNTNDVTAAIRFLPVNAIRRPVPGDGKVQLIINVNFDAAVQFSGIGLQLPR
ncbi:MAG: carboxypeptidase regulatory-like domain-containing protein [Bryobacteraceae bacterium]|nr:carboxypeptidase regulatory-like domain-containing protein [Bryobacteraceae bacterium]